MSDLDKPLRLSVMDLLEDGFHFEEGPVFWAGREVGWHAQAVRTARKDAFAGGTSSSRDLARRIAVSEALERELVSSLSVRPLGDDRFLLGEFPTTCGFACGFEDRPARLRSVAEAVERWAWSKWIDDRLPLDERTLDRCSLSPWIKGLLEPFERIRWFFKSFVVDVPGLGQQIALDFNVLIGEAGQGAYPGSRVCSPIEEGIEHAAIECWRGFQAAPKTSGLAGDLDMATRRVQHFATRKSDAVTQVSAAQAGDGSRWDAPRLRLHRPLETGTPGVYMWRSLCHDFVGWQKGPINRFVY